MAWLFWCQFQLQGQPIFNYQIILFEIQSHLCGACESRVNFTLYSLRRCKVVLFVSHMGIFSFSDCPTNCLDCEVNAGNIKCKSALGSCKPGTYHKSDGTCSGEQQSRIVQQTIARRAYSLVSSRQITGDTVLQLVVIGHSCRSGIHTRRKFSNFRRF